MPAPTSAITRHASSGAGALLASLALALLAALPAHAQEAAPAADAQQPSRAPYSFAPVEYEPARGLRFGNSGLTLGAFGTF
ncbi:MAG: hypothetical protein FJ091_07120 [Deltaproteobacteria bacterium]|nr:hypothetical protein [Deltaproteobacteria bacterium]